MVSLFLSYSKLKKKMPPKNFLHGSWEGFVWEIRCRERNQEEEEASSPTPTLRSRVASTQAHLASPRDPELGSGGRYPGGPGTGWGRAGLGRASAPWVVLALAGAGPSGARRGRRDPAYPCLPLGVFFAPHVPPLWPGLLGFRPGSVWRHSLSPGRDTFFLPNKPWAPARAPFQAASWGRCQCLVPATNRRKRK